MLKVAQDTMIVSILKINLHVFSWSSAHVNLSLIKKLASYNKWYW